MRDLSHAFAAADAPDDDVDTVDRLKNCTTDPVTGFFDIGTDNKIAGAFDAIKGQIMAQIRIGK